jgi:nitronate monooxygenase
VASWPDHRIQKLLGIELPIIQAPMAGANLSAMVIAVSQAGALGSLPCAMLSADQMRAELETIRRQTSRSVNVNFFCHQPPAADPQRDQAWKQHLAKYYVELGLDPEAPVPSASRRPFDEAACDLLVELKPEVVSFHFGLPNQQLLSHVRSSGAKILSSATTVDEARWLEQAGCDAIIAQGYEAGGHRGMFLTDDITTQAATMALVPQMVDAVRVPVIAAGGIADARGIVAAFALGAAAVQLGTAYLLCPEATLSAVHRQAIKNLKDNGTAITNVFSGRPARGIVNRLVREAGPMSALAPSFPLAGSAITPLRKKSESMGSEDFAQMWSGQSGRLCRELPAGELTRQLASETLTLLSASSNK